MSGIKPLFTSAPRIKVKIDGLEIAYAIGLNINVGVDLKPVNIIGKFGAVSIEPTLYNVVTGTMQIVKMNTRDQVYNQSLKLPGAKYNSVVGTGAIGSSAIGTMQLKDSVSEFANNSILTYKGLAAHLDPTKVLASETFDLELWLKPDGATTEVLWMVINDTRLASRNANISMGQLVNEPVNFQALWATPHDNLAEALFAPDFGVNV